MLEFIKLHEDAELPIRACEHDAGLDAKAVRREFLDKYGNVTDCIEDMVQVKYYLGIGCKVPKGYGLFAFCKSSVYKKGMNLSNAVGVIDCGYQGEISVIFNLTSHSKPYHVGDAVCQLVLIPIETPDAVWGEFTEKTQRGTGGYGHSGNLFKK